MAIIRLSQAASSLLLSIKKSFRGLLGRNEPPPVKDAGTERLDNLGLTPREREVFLHLLSGEASKRIAGSLMISNATVNFHIRNLYRKLGIQSRAELFARHADMILKNDEKKPSSQG